MPGEIDKKSPDIIADAYKQERFRAVKHSKNATYILDRTGAKLFTVWAKPTCTPAQVEDMRYRARQIADFLNGKEASGHEGTINKWRADPLRPNLVTNAVHIRDEAGIPLITVWAKPTDKNTPMPTNEGHSSISVWTGGTVSHDQEELRQRTQRLTDFLNGK